MPVGVSTTSLVTLVSILIEPGLGWSQLSCVLDGYVRVLMMVMCACQGVVDLMETSSYALLVCC